MDQRGGLYADTHFEKLPNQSFWRTIKGVGKAAYTLFNVPEHDSSLYEDLAQVLIHEPQPVHAPLEDEVRAVGAVCRSSIDTAAHPKISGKLILGHLGIFMQFSSYVPDLHPYGQTDFMHIDNLYSVLTEAGKRKPLGYAEQLKIAIEQTGGNLPEAIWRLFVTSRQHGRWFDESIITKMPNFTREQKLERMYVFAKSVAASKPHNTSPIQDSSGDTYYTWTHALGGLMFDALPYKQHTGIKCGALLMRHGTTLMHSLAHRYKPQRLTSDHTTAARYGNAIGSLLAQRLSGIA